MDVQCRVPWYLTNSLHLVQQHCEMTFRPPLGGTFLCRARLCWQHGTMDNYLVYWCATHIYIHINLHIYNYIYGTHINMVMYIYIIHTYIYIHIVCVHCMFLLCTALGAWQQNWLLRLDTTQMAGKASSTRMRSLGMPSMAREVTGIEVQ